MANASLFTMHPVGYQLDPLWENSPSLTDPRHLKTCRGATRHKAQDCERVNAKSKVENKGHGRRIANEDTIQKTSNESRRQVMSAQRRFMMTGQTSG